MTLKGADVREGRSLSRTFCFRNQLQDLTASVESCQSEVVEVKRDMVAIKHEIDTLQAAKHEIEELREAVDRLEETHRKRKVRLLEQVSWGLRRRTLEAWA